MNKAIIIAIIVIVILVIAGIGVYLFMMNGGVAPVQNQQDAGTNNPKNYEVQGMKIEITQEGVGNKAKNEDRVTVHYTGTLQDGTKFDSSVDRNAPFSFVLGKGTVIKGWDLGVVGMKVGEKRTLTIPPDLAYGVNGFPPIIPKSAVLTFQVELLKIN